jgi:hypothetical protein
VRILTIERTETTFEAGYKGERRLPNFSPWKDLLLPPIPCNDFPGSWRPILSRRPGSSNLRILPVATNSFSAPDSPLRVRPAQSLRYLPFQATSGLNCGLSIECWAAYIIAGSASMQLSINYRPKLMQAASIIFIERLTRITSGVLLSAMLFCLNQL